MVGGGGGHIALLVARMSLVIDLSFFHFFLVNLMRNVSIADFHVSHK